MPRERTTGLSARAILARNVRRLRQAQDISQAVLGRRARIPGSRISNIENETYGSSIETIEKLARGLGVPLTALVEIPPPDDDDDET